MTRKPLTPITEAQWDAWDGTPPGYPAQPKVLCRKCGRFNVWYIPECKGCGAKRE